MERKIELKSERIDDDFIEVSTIIKEKMSNREFYQYWINLTSKREGTKMSIRQAEESAENLKKQLDVQVAQIKDFEWQAKECEARIGKNIIT